MMMADEDPELETVQAPPVAAARGKEAKIDLAPNQEGGEDSDPELDQLLDRMYAVILIKAHRSLRFPIPYIMKGGSITQMHL